MMGFPPRDLLTDKILSARHLNDCCFAFIKHDMILGWGVAPISDLDMAAKPVLQVSKTWDQNKFHDVGMYSTPQKKNKSKKAIYQNRKYYWIQMCDTNNYFSTHELTTCKYNHAKNVPILSVIGKGRHFISRGYIMLNQLFSAFGQVKIVIPPKWCFPSSIHLWA